MPTITTEPWGGLVVSWRRRELELLVDQRDAWLALGGRLLWRVRVGVA